MTREVLGLVSYDHLNAPQSAGSQSALAVEAMALLDKQGCSAVLFSLPVPSSADAEVGIDWDALKSVRSVYLGRADGRVENVRPGGSTLIKPFDLVERGNLRANAPDFMRVVRDRTANGPLVIFGSELPHVTLKRTPDRHFEVPEGWEQTLAEQRVSLILMPLVSYMRRWEIKPKRAFFSRNGRTVVSVWNRTTQNESERTWTVHNDGVERSGDVRRVDGRLTPPGLVIGTLDLKRNPSVPALAT